MSATSIYGQALGVTPVDSDGHDTIASMRTTEHKPIVAVKTNLLYDAALTPNIEVERWLGNHAQYSLDAEFNFPWYTWHNYARAYEVMEVGLEWRVWHKRRTQWGSPKENPLLGQFYGFYGAGGYYDLEWNYKGNRGHFYSAGFTYGYATPIGRHLHLEFSASIGGLLYFNKRYNDPQHNNQLHRLYKKTKFYAGPTKLKISLVWVINKHIKHSAP